MHKEIFLICLSSMAIIFPKIEFFIKTITVARSTDKSFDIKNRKIRIIKNKVYNNNYRNYIAFYLQTCKKNFVIIKHVNVLAVIFQLVLELQFTNSAIKY
jgi:hypothetical protein